MRCYLNQLATGRLLAIQHHRGQCERSAPTRAWIDKVGLSLVDITQNAPDSVIQDWLMAVSGPEDANVRTTTVEVTAQGDVYPLSLFGASDHQGCVRGGDKQA